MGRMDTRTESLAPVPNWLDPFGSWDAAARWNAIASEWVTKGWQQWLELVSVWPALETSAPVVAPVQAGTQEERNAHAIRQAHAEAVASRPRANAGAGRSKAAKPTDRPAARAASKRPAPRRPARAQAAARATRSRG
jgi:hypothetical protein